MTFVKRKAGLFKKAHELAVLCQVELALVVLTPDGRVFEYSTTQHSSEVMQKCRTLPVTEHKRPADFGFEARALGDDDSPPEDDDSEMERRHSSKEDISTSRYTSPPPNSLDRASRPKLKVQIPGSEPRPLDMGPLSQPLAQPLTQQPHGRQQVGTQLNHINQLGQLIHVGSQLGPQMGPQMGPQLAQMSQMGHSGPQVNQGQPRMGQPPIEQQMAMLEDGPGPLTALASATEPLTARIPRGSDSSSGHSSLQSASASTEVSKHSFRQDHPTLLPHTNPPNQPYALPPQFAYDRGVPASPSQGYYSNYYPYHGQPGQQGQLHGQPGQPGQMHAVHAMRNQPGPPQGQMSGHGSPGQLPHQPGVPGVQSGAQPPGPPNLTVAVPSNMPANVPNSTGSTSNPAGRWSAYPQSPVTYLVNSEAKSEQPVSAIPSRYVSEMLSPSNYFSLEWGVWDPQASAMPGGTARVLPPSGHPDNKIESPSPKLDASGSGIERKRRKT